MSKETKTYKIWMSIEERTIHEDGEETFENIDDITVSAGEWDTLGQAIEAMDGIHAIHGYDNTKANNRDHLVETLMELRKDWTREDYKKAYANEIREINFDTASIGLMRSAMETRLYHYHDLDYLKELIENEKE